MWYVLYRIYTGWVDEIYSFLLKKFKVDFKSIILAMFKKFSEIKSNISVSAVC